MKLIETTVSETTVHLQLADDADLERATEWFEFEVPLEGLVIVRKKTPSAILQSGVSQQFSEQPFIVCWSQ
jgi:hypothetical protein